jgi:hypothetical protein
MMASFLSSPEAQPFVQLYAQHGAPFQFSTDDPCGFLREHGWEAQMVDVVAEAARLGRPMPGPVSRGVILTAKRR